MRAAPASATIANVHTAASRRVSPVLALSLREGIGEARVDPPAGGERGSDEVFELRALFLQAAFQTPVFGEIHQRRGPPAARPPGPSGPEMSAPPRRAPPPG